MTTPPPEALRSKIENLCTGPEASWSYLGCKDGEVFIVTGSYSLDAPVIMSRTVQKRWGFRGDTTAKVLPPELFPNYVAWVLENA